MDVKAKVLKNDQRISQSDKRHVMMTGTFVYFVYWWFCPVTAGVAASGVDDSAVRRWPGGIHSVIKGRKVK